MPGRVTTFGLTPAVQRVMRFDRVTPDRVNRAMQTLACPAGKSVNAGWAARLAGADVTVVAPLGGAGSGSGGVWMQARLREAGIAVVSAEPGHEVRTCVTVLDEAAGTVTELVEETPAMSEGVLETLLTGLGGQEPGGGLVCCGTLAPGAPEDSYARAMRAGRWAFALIDAKGPALLAAIGERSVGVRVAKLNGPELEQTVGAGGEDGVRRLLAAGATHVVVTDGAGPVMVAGGGSGEAVRVLTPPAVRRVNTTGCGDCVAGVLAAGLTEGGVGFLGVVRAALAAASASAETLLPAVFDPHRQRELLGQWKEG